MAEFSTLAAVDLGSNSFRLQVARVVDEEIYPLDSLREPVRLGAGLTQQKHLDEPSQARALQCIARFGERLRGFPAEAVRAVGTNTLRVAKNAAEFLRNAEAALGFPIEVVAGREEARLIYLGVAHSLPPSAERRLVVDIGGGSTEFIIGSGYRPLKLESLYMGCVSYSLRYFPGGRINKANLREAELASRIELETIANEFSAGHFAQAVGSSGTARALGELLEQQGFPAGAITAEGLEWLRSALLKVGDATRLSALGVRADRLVVLPGGFAIMAGIFAQLRLERMALADGALREGILYDLLGRFHHHDRREVTVAQFAKRYSVDLAQAQRVEGFAQELLRQINPAAAAGDEHVVRLMSWVATLHEIGLSVAHSGYHKHTAYLLSYSDMPGFSRMEQSRLSLLTLAHRGSLDKIQDRLDGGVDLDLAMALRLSALFHRSRGPLDLARYEASRRGARFQLDLDAGWLADNPLTAAALVGEQREWHKLGVSLEVNPLSEARAGNRRAVE